MMTTTEAAPTHVEIANAIKATEYKYFGDYEMSDAQRDAVDVLVRAAKAFSQPSPASSIAGEGNVHYFRTCPRCNGYGGIGHGDATKCQECHGNGVVKLSPSSGEPASPMSELQALGQEFDAPVSVAPSLVGRRTVCPDCGKAGLFMCEHVADDPSDILPSPASVAVEAKPWYETDAHRDLSRIIPDMEGKIGEAKTRYAHCLPDHLFAPLEASISELKVLRHEVAVEPAPSEERLREAASIIEQFLEYLGDDPWHMVGKARDFLAGISSPLSHDAEGESATVSRELMADTRTVCEQCGKLGAFFCDHVGTPVTGRGQA